MDKRLPIYDVVAGDMSCLSLVEHPAIELDFQLFSKVEELRFSLDEERHIAFGAAMVAGLPILRKAADGSLFYIVFSADVIRTLVQSFMANNERTFTEEHDGKPLEGITILESFFKSPTLQPKGFESVADGSWFVSLKIDNEQVWKDLKSGARRGFSIECHVTTEERPQVVEMRAESDWVDDLLNSL